MTFYDYFLILFFLCWFILTGINQFDFYLSKKIKRLDIFNLIPKWTFFAPNPATTDLHLLFREKDSEGNISSFKEFPLFTKKNILTTFFNPSKRAKKSLQDLVRGLSKSCASGRINEKNIKVSFNYIAILNFLTQVKKRHSTKSIQFLVMRSNGYKSNNKPEVLIISDFHEV